MAAFSTVDINDLVVPSTLDTAIQMWCNFVELCPKAISASIAPRWELQNSADSEWAMSAGLVGSQVKPLGCYFLRDIEVNGSGYIFSSGSFVKENVHTSIIAQNWLEQPDFPDNPLVRPRERRVVIDEPVLLVFGPGSSIFGHWLMDFLPRIMVAQRLLKDRMDSFVLLLPADAPGWVPQMITHFCGIAPERIRTYDRMEETVLCRTACLPKFAHNGDYALHPIMRDFYDTFVSSQSSAPTRRICLSRRNQELHTYSYWRIFEARDIFERLAIKNGFEIVQPELLDFTAQVDLFRSANCIVGEHGSGMHASVFANPGTTVATIGANNGIQFQIGATFDHHLVCMRRLEVLEDVPGRRFRFTANQNDLESFLARLG